jgi:aspartate carbamoyltransferase regulatory subunit
MSDIEKDIIEAHKTVIEELYCLDPNTQEFQRKISNFLLKHPELSGISYVSAEMIMKEKDPYIRAAAIKTIATEIKHRKDVDAPGYRITYTSVSTNQVQTIISNEKQKRNPIKKEVKPQKRTVQLKCPYCQKAGSFEEVKRDKVIAFRTTGAMDNAIDILAKKCGISRSLLVSELLFIEKRFGSIVV